MTEKQLLDTVCSEVSPGVAKRIRKVHRSGRRSADPNFWGNVMLREHWRENHGSYDEWDRVARASGVDPLLFGRAD